MIKKTRISKVVNETAIDVVLAVMALLYVGIMLMVPTWLRVLLGVALVIAMVAVFWVGLGNPIRRSIRDDRSEKNEQEEMSERFATIEREFRSGPD